jgi:hypothetical protein
MEARPLSPSIILKELVRPVVEKITIIRFINLFVIRLSRILISVLILRSGRIINAIIEEKTIVSIRKYVLVLFVTSSTNPAKKVGVAHININNT